MAMPNPYQQYQLNSINSASPGELTLMLYNGAIRFINTAIKGIEDKDYQKANDNNVKAQEIILYLSSTLDMNYDISKNLSSLYDYMYNRLIWGNINKNNEALVEVLGLLEDLRDAWGQMLKQLI